MIQNKNILLCASIALSTILGNFVHSFVKLETHFSISETYQTTEIHDEGHSHSHDEEIEETSSISKHVHSHNSIDHSHDLPVILMKHPPSVIGRIVASLQLRNDLAMSHNVHGLERPPRGSFLVTLS